MDNGASELVAKLQRNARFYASESKALAEDITRRDNRHLGAEEAKTIADLLQQAADSMTALGQYRKELEQFRNAGP